MRTSLDYLEVGRYATREQALEWLVEQGIDPVGLVREVELVAEGAVDVTFYADEAGEPTREPGTIAVDLVRMEACTVTLRLPVSRLPEWWPLDEVSTPGAELG